MTWTCGLRTGGGACAGVVRDFGDAAGRLGGLRGAARATAALLTLAGAAGWLATAGVDSTSGFGASSSITTGGSATVSVGARLTEPGTARRGAIPSAAALVMAGGALVSVWMLTAALTSVTKTEKPAT